MLYFDQNPISKLKLISQDWILINHYLRKILQYYFHLNIRQLRKSKAHLTHMENEKDKKDQEKIDEKIQLIVNKNDEYAVRYGRTGHHG